jgi:DNA-binding NtrC family response regulator
MLMTYDWPGNIRELRNVIERAMILSNKRTIEPENLQFMSGVGTVNETLSHENVGINHSTIELPGKLDDISMKAEKQHIEQILVAQQWNLTKTARILHVSRPKLYRKLKKYNLQPQMRP